jgi:ribosomal-protein-alanine N-acetyltransferase
VKVSGSHEFQLRLFRPADLKNILSIERAAFPREPYDRELFLELYRDCGGLFIVAKCSGRIAGYMVSCAKSGKAEIVSIAVHPKYQKLGVGSALMVHTLAALKKKKVQSVKLMVKTTNSSGVRFYRRFGFIRVRRVPRYYEDGADAFRMSLAKQRLSR